MGRERYSGGKEERCSREKEERCSREKKEELSWGTWTGILRWGRGEIS